MSLQPLFVLMSVSFILLAEPVSTFAQSSPTQSSPEETQPASTQGSNESHNPTTQVLFKPSGTGRPPTTRGAGSRNDRLCPQDAPTNPGSSAAESIALTALVPNDREGLTGSEHPMVWIYLPRTSARQIVLSVREEGEGSQAHFQRFLPITGEPGIMGIPLKDAPPLQVGKSYQWAVVLLCGDRPSPNDPVVTAWIRRVAPAQPLNNQQSALERAVSYGEQGIWYDALTTLAEAQQSQPNNPAFTKIWADFLAQPNVGLGAIANEPLR